MSSKSKFKPLEVGERVFIESKGFYDRGRPSLIEHEVIETNKSSAYITPIVAGIPKHTEKRFCRRVLQKDGKIMQVFAGYHDRLWRSEQEFLNFYDRVELKKKYIEEAHLRVMGMTIKELEEFLGVKTVD